MDSQRFIEILRSALISASAEDTTRGLSRALLNLKREVDIFENYIQSRAKNSTARNFDKIQIGGGTHILEGFVNIDAFPPADIIWDVRESIPLVDNCAQFVFSEHFLEHIDYPRSVLSVFAELKRIVRPGGEVVIGVPDGELAAKKYVAGDSVWLEELKERWYAKRDCVAELNTPIDLLNIHFRDQDDSMKYTPHLWAYDFEKIAILFIQHGFENPKPWKFDSSIANSKREWGSLYVHATKTYD